ncbi:YicC/YloC family endoribonuclease [Ensifer soli]|uniref:YicC/YloC family endoribonuclease n=1 Tax=Ciceribacter sp. sgz301302 TaxID=3342379 RepID=UPI0035B6C201
MPLQSMTGFARQEGTAGTARFVWELRSVNGKALELRFRLPPGLDHLEHPARALASGRLTRGNLQIGLSLAARQAPVTAVVNRDALAAVIALRTELGGLIDPAPLRLDTLLSLRGVVEFREVDEADEERAARDAALLDALARAFDALRTMREGEGEALRQVLAGHLDRIAALVESVEADPSRSQAAIAARLAQQVSTLADSGLDRDRLHLEAALLAAKSDLREEIDRLRAHVVAARDLLAEGRPVGRKLDFLAQEFNRESNTICSKSNAVAVTAAGIELKVVIDQFREQVQNLE